jgi:hypothetical protein
MKAAYFAEAETISALRKASGVNENLKNLAGQTFRDVLNAYSHHVVQGKKPSLESIMLIENKK